MQVARLGSLEVPPAADQLGVDPSAELAALHLEILRDEPVLDHRTNLRAELTSFVGHDTNRVLAACPQVRIMATSREPLNITGEALWTVGPLTLPGSRRIVVRFGRTGRGACRCGH